MVFVAGQILTAGDLNDLTRTVYAAADQTVNGSTTLVNATGMSFALSANATYAIEGWIRWTSNPSADFKCGWSTPASSDGWWTFFNPYLA
jgi:hypothetical protein